MGGWTDWHTVPFILKYGCTLVEWLVCLWLMYRVHMMNISGFACYWFDCHLYDTVAMLVWLGCHNRHGNVIFNSVFTVGLWAMGTLHSVVFIRYAILLKWRCIRDVVTKVKHFTTAWLFVTCPKFCRKDNFTAIKITTKPYFLGIRFMS